MVCGPLSAVCIVIHLHLWNVSGILIQNMTKIQFLSVFVMVICVILAVIIYFYTGNPVVAILLAPPIFYWIMKKRREDL